MKKHLILALSLVLMALAVPALADTTLNCAKPPLESVRLLCQASAIKARRVQTVIGGAVVGALLGNLMAGVNGYNRTNATIAGAAAGGLGGYWLSVQNEIASKNASQTAQSAELKTRAAADAKSQKKSAASLKGELKTVLLRSPGTAADEQKRQAAIAQIAQAADLGAKQAQDSGQGYTAVGNQLGTPVDAKPMFASTASDFSATKNDACARLTHPGSYCS